MSQQPKPPLATSAAVLLIIVGALNLISVPALFDLGGIGTVVGVLGLILGIGGILGGIQVLQLKEQGRVMGMAVAGVGALFNVYAITQGITPQFVGLALNAFIIYALVQTKPSFTR